MAELLEPQSSDAFPEHFVVQSSAPSGEAMGAWEPQRHCFPTRESAKAWQSERVMSKEAGD